MKPLFIAEVKTKSPFGPYDPTANWDKSFDFANRIGDIISIHTEVPWGGSPDLITKAKARTDKLILAKGYHKSLLDIHNSFLCGATYVLAIRENNEDLKYLVDLIRIGSFYLTKSDDKSRIIIEAWDLPQLKVIEDLRHTHAYFPMVVWNQRDLSTGLPKKETFDEARKIYKGLLIQASLLKTREDISSEADGVLVGTYLENFL